jgi:uncharacterized protein (TIGR00369 family)
MTEREIALDPPPGYSEHSSRGAFSQHNGPYFLKGEGDDFRLGFRVLPRHCNSYGVVHGGMVMTFADRLLATAVAMKAPQRMLTVRMTTDFIGMARAGDWVEGKGRVTRAGRSLVFVEGSADVLGGRPIFSASGVFKVFERKARVT